MPDDTATSTEDTATTDAAAQATAQAQEAAAAAAADSDADEDEGLDPKVKAKIEKANREAKNLRERIKALEPLAREAETKRKGEQTVAERLTEEKAALEVQLAELTTANVRRDAAEAAGLPARFVKFITAADAEEALAQAKELAKELKPDAGEKPKEKRGADLRQGARGSANTGNQLTPDDMLRQMARR